MKPKVSVIVPVYNVDKYVKRMLNCLAKQTLKEFEVILIDDGSTDDSLKTIESFCLKDSRFSVFSQKNQGVSAARNAGLEHAVGKYVAFYDPDDTVPSIALQALYKRIEEEDADIVIGVMETVENFRSRYALPVRRLALNKVIDSYAPLLLTNFSLANKLFRRKMIEDNNIRFDNVSYSEDGAFVLNCVTHSSKIAGCNENVYTYYLRAFWEEPSITQSIKIERLEDALNAYSLIEQRIKDKIALDQSELNGTVTEERYQNAVKRHKAFLNRFYRRVISRNLISGFYRRIWRAQDDIYSILMEGLNEMKGKVSQKAWDYLKTVHSDLNLELPLPTRRQIAESPKVSFIISDNIDQKQLALILKGIYYQDMPYFEVLVEESLREHVPQAYNEIENMNFFCKRDFDLFEEAKGEYINVVSENIFQTKDCIKKMYMFLKSNPEVGFVTIPIKQICDNGETIDSPLMGQIYNERIKNLYGMDIDKLDIFISNKLFRKNALSKKGITHLSLLENSIDAIYDKIPYSQIIDEFMVSHENIDDLLCAGSSEIISILEADMLEIYGRVKRWTFKHIKLPLYYKLKCMKKVDPQKVIILKGESNPISYGLSLIKEQLSNDKEKKVIVHSIDRKSYHCFRLKRLCEELADAAVIYTDSKDNVKGIRIRKETKLIVLTPEFRANTLLQNENTKTLRKKLMEKYPQARKKKWILLKLDERLGACEMDELRGSLEGAYMVLLWTETNSVYDDLKPYDSVFLNISNFLTEEEAIYVSDYVLSSKKEDLEISGFLGRKSNLIYGNVAKFVKCEHIKE